MKLLIRTHTILLYLFALYCFICFQITEIKISNIKFNEFITLLITPLILFYVKRINKYLFYFLLFFIVILLITFVKNLTQTFYFDTSNLSILKKPYLISISRFVEFFTCFVFAVVTYKAFLYFKNKGYSKATILNVVLQFNLVFSLFLIFFYLLYFFKFLNYLQSDIIYDTTPYLPEPQLRLKGFYVEGGPLGLFYAFLFCISDTINKKKYFQKAVFLIIIFLSLSKAGIIAVVGWYSYKIFSRFRNHALTKYVIFLIILPLFVYVSFKIADNYLESYRSATVLVAKNPEDYNLVMGRLAAFFIAPNMIKHNPVFGIGLGNYSLVRNDPRYLDVIPAVPEWDLPGLGGFITLLIENGLFGLILFLLIIYIIYKKYHQNSIISRNAVIIFAVICSLGVQLYFLYIWFLIGLAVVPDNEDKEDVVNS